MNAATETKIKQTAQQRFNEYAQIHNRFTRTGAISAADFVKLQRLRKTVSICKRIGLIK